MGLGIAFCAPPGAVNAESLRRGLVGGYRHALLLQLGSLLGDATWAALALLGSALLVRNAAVRVVLGVAGVAFLLRLSLLALRDAWTGSQPLHSGRTGGDFRTGALLSLANPYALAFWLGVGGAMASLGVTEPEPRHFVVFFAGFLGGALAWVLLICGLVGWGRRLARPATFRWVNLACGLALGYYGLKLLSRLLEQVL